MIGLIVRGGFLGMEESSLADHTRAFESLVMIFWLNRWMGAAIEGWEEYHLLAA